MISRSIRMLTVSVLLLSAVLGCNTTPTQDGAVVGGAVGAASGAIIGHQSGKQGEGALIGAGLGALVGALVGDELDERGIVSKPRANAAQFRSGHYEMRTVTAPSGEMYEERVWVPE